MTAGLLESPIGVVVVDDDTLRRGAFSLMLEPLPNVKVLGEAMDGYEAIEMVLEHNPNIVLMNISLPVLDGIEATRCISSQFPDTKIIVFTMHHNDQAHSEIALEAGACRFLPKNCTKERLLQAIRECSPIPSSVIGVITDPS